MPTIIVRSETPADVPGTAGIVRQAFGRDDAMLLLEALRKTEDFVPRLSMVAEVQKGQPVGYALFLRVACSDGKTSYPSAHLYPLAVLPQHQKQGIGERLVRSGLEHCRALDIDLVFVTSAPEFFSRMGFQPARPMNFETNLKVSEQAFQVLDLTGKLLGKTRGLVSFGRPFLETLS